MLCPMGHSSDDSGSNRDIPGILRRRNHLGSLVARARAYGELERKLAPILPSMLHGRLKVACVRDRSLVLAVESPAWATRARTLTQPILAEAKKHWPAPIDEVRIILNKTTPGQS